MKYGQKNIKHLLWCFVEEARDYYGGPLYDGKLLVVT